MTIVITRAKEDSAEFISLLKEGREDYFVFPCLAFTAPDDNYLAVNEAIRKNQSFDWLVFLSRRAAQSFFNRLLELGGQFFHLAVHLKIAVIGTSTKEFIENEINFPVNFYPTEFNSDAFIDEFLKHLANELSPLKPLKLLIPRTSIADDTIINGLEGSGFIHVTQVPVYKTIKPEISDALISDLRQILENSKIGVQLHAPQVKMTFTSSQCVRNFFEIIAGKLDISSFCDVLEFHSIGPKVTLTLGEYLGARGLAERIPVIQAKEALLSGFSFITQSSQTSP